MKVKIILIVIALIIGVIIGEWFSPGCSLFRKVKTVYSLDKPALIVEKNSQLNKDFSIDPKAELWGGIEGDFAITFADGSTIMFTYDKGKGSTHCYKGGKEVFGKEANKIWNQYIKEFKPLLDTDSDSVHNKVGEPRR